MGSGLNRPFPHHSSPLTHLLHLHFTPRFLHFAGFSLRLAPRHANLASIQVIFPQIETWKFHGNDPGYNQGRPSWIEAALCIVNAGHFAANAFLDGI
jgi:hypothetical protein